MSSMTTPPRPWRTRLVVVALGGAFGLSLPAPAAGHGSGLQAPVSKALDTSDGGHAALIEVLRRMGRRVPEDLIKDAGQKGARITIAEMAFRSAQAGLPAVVLPVPVKCLRPALAKIPLPAIALVGNRYLIIESRPEGEFATLIDPATGRVRKPLSALGRDWKETVVTFGASGPNPAVPCE